jgi:hypothetical protein
MWNLLVRAEIFVDNILLKVGSGLIYVFKLIVPEKYRNSFFSLEDKLESWVKNKREKIQTKTMKLLENVKKETLQKVQEVKSYDYRGQAISQKEKILKIIKENSPKALLVLVLGYLAIPGNKIKMVLSNLSPGKLLAGIAGVTVFGLASLNIYYEGRKIVTTSENTREPASYEEGERDLEVEGLDPRPSYHKKQLKQLKLTHVKMPVYYRDINELHTLDIDFSLQANNRYTIKYIDQYEHELRDHILMTIEPVVPEFPMEEEGRDIVKEKILYEINDFLRSNKVEGYIEEVKVIYILGN